MSGVISGGVEHAEPGKTRVQQHGSATKRHQLVGNEDYCVLGRHADQGTVSPPSYAYHYHSLIAT